MAGALMSVLSLVLALQLIGVSTATNAGTLKPVLCNKTPNVCNKPTRLCITTHHLAKTKVNDPRACESTCENTPHGQCKSFGTRYIPHEHKYDCFTFADTTKSMEPKRFRYNDMELDMSDLSCFKSCVTAPTTSKTTKTSTTSRTTKATTLTTQTTSHTTKVITQATSRSVSKPAATTTTTSTSTAAANSSSTPLALRSAVLSGCTTSSLSGTPVILMTPTAGGSASIAFPSGSLPTSPGTSPVQIQVTYQTLAQRNVKRQQTSQVCSMSLFVNSQQIGSPSAINSTDGGYVTYGEVYSGGKVQTMSVVVSCPPQANPPSVAVSSVGWSSPSSSTGGSSSSTSVDGTAGSSSSASAVFSSRSVSYIPPSTTTTVAGPSVTPWTDGQTGQYCEFSYDTNANCDMNAVYYGEWFTPVSTFGTREACAEWYSTLNSSYPAAFMQNNTDGTISCYGYSQPLEYRGPANPELDDGGQIEDAAFFARSCLNCQSTPFATPTVPTASITPQSAQDARCWATGGSINPEVAHLYGVASPQQCAGWCASLDPSQCVSMGFTVNADGSYDCSAYDDVYYYDFTPNDPNAQTMFLRQCFTPDTSPIPTPSPNPELTCTLNTDPSGNQCDRSSQHGQQYPSPDGPMFSIQPTKELCANWFYTLNGGNGNNGNYPTWSLTHNPDGTWLCYAYENYFTNDGSGPADLSFGWYLPSCITCTKPATCTVATSPPSTAGCAIKGFNAPASPMKTVSSVASTDACSAACQAASGCVSFWFGSSGTCDLYTTDAWSAIGSGTAGAGAAYKADEMNDLACFTCQ